MKLECTVLQIMRRGEKKEICEKKFITYYEYPNLYAPAACHSKLMRNSIYLVALNWWFV